MTGAPDRGTPEAAHALAAVLFLLPFELRRPTVRALGLELTTLELAAALAILVLVVRGRSRLGELARRPPWPLVWLAAFAAAHLLSAALAQANRGLALKFALRMVAAAAFAVAVALAPPEAHRKGLVALAAAALLVGVLALAEGAGVRSIDPVLDLFRESAVVVGGTRRATAGSESPNLAAAALIYGLVAGIGSRVFRPRPLGSALLFSVVPALGLLATYSRGALVAAAIGLLALAVSLGRSRRGLAAAPAGALAALVAGAILASSGATYRLRWIDDRVETWYRASYEPTEATLLLTPRESHSLTVVVTNTGRQAWTADGAFSLSYHWYDLDRGENHGDGFGPTVRRPVGAGNRVSLRVAVRAPESEGRYVLLLDMLHTHVGWFSRLGVSPAAVPVSVSVARSLPPPVVSSPPPVVPAEWRPGRRDLWGLALAMWRDNPWTGVGSDNFRWLSGPYAGRSNWDSRTFANSAFLEIAATTGALGLLAFAGALVSTGLAALRALAAAPAGSSESALPAVLLALTAVLVVHGFVDYTLAFTGHYLFFGFLVGAASAREAHP